MQEGCVSLPCLLPQFNYGLRESNESANEAIARERDAALAPGGMVKSPAPLPRDCVIVLNKTAMGTQMELVAGNVFSLHQRANANSHCRFDCNICGDKCKCQVSFDNSKRQTIATAICYN